MPWQILAPMAKKLNTSDMNRNSIIHTALPLFVLLCYIPVFAQTPSAYFLGSPMVGHVSSREARIWVRTNVPAQVQIRYLDSIEGRTYRTTPRVTNSEMVNTATIVLDSVEPGKVYHYDVMVNGLSIGMPWQMRFTTPAVWKWQKEPIPSATFAMGSCNYVNEEGYERSTGGYGSEPEIFESIAKKKPQVMLWLGDNTYLREPDWGSRSGMIKRYAHTRVEPNALRLFSTVANYAIWDDHDFGPNDSDRSWPLKKDALEIFSAFWPNPSAGVNEKPGITTKFEWLDVDFFLLDDRYYRSVDKRTDGDRTILGEHQVQWLIDALASSTATFKVVAVGSQFLSDNLGKECFSRVPEERKRIIDMITLNKIKGVLFVTGDIHAAELSKMERTGTYPLYELTSSSLTAGSNKNIAQQPNTYRVPGTEVGVHNFATITVRGELKSRELLLQLFDKDGKELWQRVITEKELQ